MIMFAILIEPPANDAHNFNKQNRCFQLLCGKTSAWHEIIWQPATKLSTYFTYKICTTAWYKTAEAFDWLPTYDTILAVVNINWEHLAGKLIKLTGISLCFAVLVKLGTHIDFCLL